jgi:hypothetical protein
MASPLDNATKLFDAAVDAMEKAGVSTASRSERALLVSMMERYVTETLADSDEEGEGEEQEEEGEEDAGAQADPRDGKKKNFGGSIHDRLPERMRLYKNLRRARTELRRVVPYGSITETVTVPPSSLQFQPDVPFYDVDAFLFDDEDLDGFVDAGLVHRHFCAKCESSEQIRPTQFISHSFSEEQLHFLGGFLMPAVLGAGGQKPGLPFRVADVGSRLGIVVATAAWSLQKRCREAKRPLEARGIEMNAEYCDVARRLLANVKLRAPEADIIEADAVAEGSPGAAFVGSADFVVLHNVFEWFVPFEQQLDVWRRVRTLTRGTGRHILVIPPLEETLEPLVERELALKAQAESGSSKKHRAEGAGKSRGSVSKQEVDAEVRRFIAGWAERVDTTGMAEAFMAERAEGDAESEGDTDHVSESLGNMALYRVVAAAE